MNCSRDEVIAGPGLLVRNGIIPAVDSVAPDQSLRTYLGDLMVFDYPR